MRAIKEAWRRYEGANQGQGVLDCEAAYESVKTTRGPRPGNGPKQTVKSMVIDWKIQSSIDRRRRTIRAQRMESFSEDNASVSDEEEAEREAAPSNLERRQDSSSSNEEERETSSDEEEREIFLMRKSERRGLQILNAVRILQSHSEARVVAHWVLPLDPSRPSSRRPTVERALNKIGSTSTTLHSTAESSSSNLGLALATSSSFLQETAREQLEKTKSSRNYRPRYSDYIPTPQDPSQTFQMSWPGRTTISEDDQGEEEIGSLPHAKVNYSFKLCPRSSQAQLDDIQNSAGNLTRDNFVETHSHFDKDPWCIERHASDS